MRFFLDFVKEVIFFLVLSLIMFFAWNFISNSILKKDMYFVKKKDVVVDEQVKEKKDVVVAEQVKEKKDVVVDEQVKEKKEPKQEEILLPERKPKVVNKRHKTKRLKPKVVNKRHKTKRLKRRTKQLRKSNWAREQLERYSRGEESIFTSQN